MGNDLIGPCEVFGRELKGNLGIEYCVIQVSEQIRGGVANLWVVVCGVPVLSNGKVSICVGAPGKKSDDLQRRWRRKTLRVSLRTSGQLTDGL